MLTKLFLFNNFYIKILVFPCPLFILLIPFGVFPLFSNYRDFLSLLFPIFITCSFLPLLFFLAFPSLLLWSFLYILFFNLEMVLDSERLATSYHPGDLFIFHYFFFLEVLMLLLKGIGSFLAA